MADLTISAAATLTGANTASGDLFPLLDISAAAGSQGSKITRDELRIAMGLTGNGTIATGGYTLTVPATGTAALLGANVFTTLQTITQANANTGILASTGYSLTGSNATSMIDLAGTWNTSGTPTLIKANVTNTASNGSSLLIDLQVGGSSRFKVAATTGHVTSSGGFFASGSFDLASTWGVNGSTGNQVMYVTGTFGWSAGNGGQGATADALLARKTTASIGLGVTHATTPTAQYLSAHNVTTGTGASLTLSGGTGSVAGGACHLAASVTTGAPVPRVTADAVGLGFYNVTPVARQVVPTGSSTDTLITALQTLGLISQS